MTAKPDRRLEPDDRPHPDHTPRPATHSESPRIPGDVPITVWRLDDRDSDHLATDHTRWFASRLAHRLVLVYTRYGDVVVDFDDDTELRSAADNSGRSYRSITEPASIADLDRLTQPISLIVLQWPRDHRGTNLERVSDLFTACRLMASADASVVAAVRPGHQRHTGATFADHERLLRMAAQTAGLTHVLQIVAVSAPGQGDQFLYYADQSEAQRAESQASATDGLHVMHIDLLVFHT
jgi:hypothetical protein